MPIGRTRIGLALALGLAAATFSASAGAQDLPLHLRQPGLLLNRGVVAELEPTDEESEKFKKLAQEAQEKYQLAQRTLREENGPDRAAREKALDAALNREVTDAMADLLRPEQLRRFNQIELRWRGPAAFDDPAIRTRLDLTEAQANEATRLSTDFRERMRAASGARPAEVRKEALEKIDTLLNDRQKRTWKEMIGRPFEFAEPS